MDIVAAELIVTRKRSHNSADIKCLDRYPFGKLGIHVHKFYFPPQWPTNLLNFFYSSSDREIVSTFLLISHQKPHSTANSQLVKYHTEIFNWSSRHTASRLQQIWRKGDAWAADSDGLS